MILPVRSYAIREDLYKINKEVQERIAEISPVKRPVVKHLLYVVTGVLMKMIALLMDQQYLQKCSW